jgi:hypothetical protein
MRMLDSLTRETYPSARQISDHEPCGLVDQRFRRFVRDHLMMQYRRVRQRLD